MRLTWICTNTKTSHVLQVMYIHRITNAAGMFDLILDQFEDIADCISVKVKLHTYHQVQVRLRHDTQWHPLSHVVVGGVPDGHAY